VGKWLAAALLVWALPAAAGEVTLRHLFLADYFSSGPSWSAIITATSTAPWPGFADRTTGVFVDPQEILESGLMLYACDVFPGCPADQAHRFVWTGPAVPDFPGLAGTRVLRSDRRLGVLYTRTWELLGASDAVDLGTTDADLGPYVRQAPVFPVGQRVVVHLADEDSIAAMLAGDFDGTVLAHRASAPCEPLRVNPAGTVLSTVCRWELR